MHETSLPAGGSAATAVIARPDHDPVAARAADPAETTRRLTENRDRTASEINDAVVRRLFSVGLTLHNALGLMDGHRAGESIERAIAELDQAIIDLRDTVFGIWGRSRCSPGALSGRPLPGGMTGQRAGGPL